MKYLLIRPGTYPNFCSYHEFSTDSNNLGRIHDGELAVVRFVDVPGDAGRGKYQTIEVYADTNSSSSPKWSFKWVDC